MSEELEVLMAVARRLDALAVPYMLTGSMAVNYYAVPRMTRDIDVVVELAATDTDRFCDAFQGEFYVDREAVRRAVAARGAFDVIHDTSVVKVDFVVRKESEYRRQEFARRRRVRIDDEVLWVVAPEDLVISKLDWARESRSEVQLGDVRNLLASVPDLDAAYLAHWTGRLGLDALYREARG